MNSGMVRCLRRGHLDDRRSGSWVLHVAHIMIRCSSPNGGPMPSTASNFDNQSLRSFLYMVETEHPDALLRIRQPVDPRIDMTATVFELERAGKSPVIIFEKPGASAMPVVTNVAANRKLLAACLGVEPANIATAFRERCQKYIPCELAKAAAWNEAASEGDEVDASKSPHPHHFSIDGGPYITAGQP